MQKKITEGSNAGNTTEQQNILNADFMSLSTQINTFISNAVYNGRNIFSAGSTSVRRPSVPMSSAARRTPCSKRARLRAALRHHPCHGCADREVHARWAERYHARVAAVISNRADASGLALAQQAGIATAVVVRTGLHTEFALLCDLTLCADDNIQVCNATTAAQYFHLLRRQVMNDVSRPLVIFTPKAPLRMKESRSRIEDVLDGSFREVLDDPRVGPVVDPVQIVHYGDRVDRRFGRLSLYSQQHAVSLADDHAQRTGRMQFHA